MKFFTLNTISALSLAALLTACGGYDTTAPVEASQTRVATTGVSTVPTPDCALEGCKGPRIIDANAEAYRYDAMRRAAEAPQS